MKGAVAAPQPRATEVGAEILARGGNAFDAAVATGFAQMIADPWMCSIGGFGTATVRTADGDAYVLEFGATAGSKTSPSMWAGQSLGRTPISGQMIFDDLRNDVGYTSICTPGTVAGFWELYERFCSMSWPELLAPAIMLARHGIRIPPFVHDYWSEEKLPGVPDMVERMKATPDCERIYLDDGQIKGLGVLHINEDYARTLEILAERGGLEFYKGDLARKIAQDLEANGSYVDLSDLDSFTVRVSDPIRTTFVDHEMLTSRPPTSGVITAELLRIMERLGVDEMTHNSAEYLDALASAMKLVHSDRRRYLGDPDFVDVPVEMLMSASNVEKHAVHIRDSQVARQDTVALQHDNTTHVSTYDEKGNCAAITHSVGRGSGVISPGLGFLYNNSMMLFDSEPESPNCIEPRKARNRGTSASIILKDGKPRLVVGAPGGSVIISSVAQTILNVLVYGMSAAEAVAAPRIHCEGATVYAEARIHSQTIDTLRERGHVVDHRVYSFDPIMSAPHAIHIPPGGKVVEAGADPRRGGGVAFSDGSAVSAIGWDTDE